MGRVLKANKAIKAVYEDDFQSFFEEYRSIRQGCLWN